MNEFVFVGGKGGVGKTTIASAYALNCAAAGLETLLVSSDPAHSTSDVFDQGFGDEPSRVEGHDGLWAMELDPEEEVERHLQEVRRRMGEQVSPAIVNEIDRQIELAHRTPGAYESALFDRVVEVMQAARPPGESPDAAGSEARPDAGPRNERAADAASSEARPDAGSRNERAADAASSETDDYDRVVFDTAPTGGTLRLLALPELLGDWLDRLVEKRAQSIDLFERAAIGDREARRRAETDPIIAHLRERKEKFEFAGETLRSNAAFYLVLNPDELSIRETRRAVDGLADHDLGVEGLVVNRVTPEPDDDDRGRGADYLARRVATERDRIETIREEFAEPVVAVVESRVEEVRGDLLAEVAEELDVEVAPTAGV